jgi:hypothetical protein
MERRSPDRKLGKSLVKNAEEREEALKLLDPERFPTIVAESSYEVIKELIGALMARQGWKANNHEEFIHFLEQYLEFSGREIIFLDNLRKLHNNITYRGYQVMPEYLRRNSGIISEITRKLRALNKD